MNKIVLFTAIILCINLSARDYFFEPITTLDGLSQNVVLDIYQCSEGYMWFGTVDGLNRFDGYDFKIYQMAVDGSNSLSSNFINAIAEDNNKNLWIGTLNRGICKFNMLTEEFTCIHNTPDEPNKINQNFAQSVFCDSKNRVWVATFKGLYCIVQNNHSSFDIHQIANDPNNSYSLYNNFVNSFYEDSKNNIWVCTQRSLDLMITDPEHPVQNKFMHFALDTNIRDLGEVIETDEGYVFSHYTGICLVQFDSGSYTNPKYTSLSNISARSIIQDWQCNIWAGNHLGIQLLEHRPDKKIPFKRTHHFTSGQTANTINNQFIRSFYIDNSGILWVGTNGGGISRYNPARTKFRHYKNTNLPGSISNNKVWGMQEDQHKNLWIGTEGGGLNLLPKEQSKNYHTGFTQFDVNPPEYQNFVFDIICLANTTHPTLWAGTGYESKLVQIEPAGDSWKIEAIPTPSENYIMTLCQDEFGTIWAGSYDGGLVKYIRNGTIEKTLLYNAQNSQLPSNVVRSIIEDSHGHLWIGTSEGLAVLSQKDKKSDTPEFVIMKNNPQDSLSLNQNYIVTIFETAEGNIWIGTAGGGLNQYIEGTTGFNGSFRNITTLDGLPSNTIDQIVEDDDGILWISSNQGLTRLNPKTLKISNYDVSDGLQDLTFACSGVKLADGELLFGGVNGFNAFYPHEITEDTVTPILALTHFELFNKTIQVGEEVDGRILLKKSINNTDTIFLKHSENNFAIHMASLHFSASGKNQYKYILEGYDKQWYPTLATDRIAAYTNLKSGWYTFKFTASNSDGYWTKTPKEITIHIDPPFWATLWFRIIGTLTILCVIVLIFQIRTQQIRKRNIALKKAVDLRTSEIEQKNLILQDQTSDLKDRQQMIVKQAQELKAQRDELISVNAIKDKLFSIVAHDLKNPFNILSGYLDMLKKQYHELSNDKRKKMITRTHESVSSIQDLLDNLLTWSRAQSGTIGFSPQKLNVIELIEESIQTVRLQAKSKEIDIAFNTTVTGLYMNVDEEQMKAVMRNLLTNSIKFTSQKGKIAVAFHENKSYIIITVSDNGIGISEENLPKLFRKDKHVTTKGTSNEHGTGLGLITSKDFVEMHKGTITMKSKEGTGTKVTVKLPK